jgi:radical SAM protein with 4Fe4S-binding SPASM domain
MESEKFRPKWIAWEVTRRCNLRCVHCRSSSEDASFETTPFPSERGRAFLDEIATFGNVVVVLTGGEPLLRPDVFDLARHGTAKGLRMCLATNGVLVTPEVCAEIEDSGIRMVSLSLDGATAATHDDFRQQPGAFDATLRAAALFRARGIPFLVNSSFTRRNMGQVQAVKDLVRSLGATAWYMFLIVPTGRGEELMKELVQGPDYDALLNWHYDAERDETELLMRPTCAPHYYRVWNQRAKADGQDRSRKSLLFGPGGGKGCVAGQSIALVDYEGNVKPCSYYLRSAGNLREKSFREIWEESPLMLELRDFGKYRGRCGQCEYLSVCGGCRARADAVYGDHLAEEPFCDYVPLRLRKRAGAVEPPAGGETHA